MNAVERMWRAIGARDWAGAERQLHAQARVSWPHTGEEWASAAAYVTAIRLNPGIPEVHVERLLSDDRNVAVLVRVEREDGERRCAGFYLLQEGRIAGGTELWVHTGSREIPPWRS